MKKSSIAICAFLVIVGLIALINPNFFIGAFVVILGVEAVANGIYGFMYLRRLAVTSDFQYPIIIRSMISLIVGFLAVFLPLKFGKAIENIWEIMNTVVALHLFITSGLLLFAAGTLRDAKVNRMQFYFEALLSIAVAVFLLLFGRLHNFVRIAGAIFIAVAAIYFAIEWFNRPIIDGTVEARDDDQPPLDE